MNGALATALSVLLLAGCARMEPPPASHDAVAEAAQWQTHRRQVEALERWRLQGRFGLAWQDGQMQGGIEWRQAGTAFELEMRGPFGASAMRLRGDLRTGRGTLQDGKRMAEGPLETLLRDYLGVALPLAELAALVRGIPGAGTGQVTFDGEARAARILQHGWQVEYQDYSCCASPSLPGQVRFARDSVRGTLAVREWRRE